ncbi:hypothetical protein IWT25_02330 [Secundilactobacillus pentosiphilus]|uniref:Uncharacterized protein n=1 Tax=Secundilactobacillus pentosiphilus TaxID=1714682 RepID=A0A1Z5IZI3_9LACO|nr:hypothetical protein [Secundilactobacillus pentosiphilus]GAX06982.1 hypothetical protein IWT25_02330 [Secundilactobacillus pentosiphilus]
MNTNDYVFYGKCLVVGTIALLTLAFAGGLVWAISEAVKNPHDFFGC